MPRDKDKDNDSRGRRDRPSGGKGRSGAARGPEKKFAKRGVRQERGRQAAMASGAPTPASATAMRRVPAATGRLAIVRRASTATIVRVAKNRSATGRRAVATRSVRSSRAATVRIIATTAAARSAPTRRAETATIPIAAAPARPRVSPTGNSATRSPIRRATAMARSGPTPRAARVFAGMATSRKAIVRTGRDRRVMAIGRRVATGRSENSTASGNFRVARRIGARARISAIGRRAANPSRGRSAKVATAPIVRRARGSTSRASTARATIAAATSARGFRVRARIACKAIGPVAIVPQGRPAIPRAAEIRSRRPPEI